LESAFLEPTATIEAMEQFCRDAKEKNALAVTVPPLFIKKVKEEMAGTAIQIAAVIGYPFGWSAIEAKVAEAILAMVDGADELEVVVNITALKNNDWQYLAKEINTLLTIIRRQGKKVCFTIETILLTEEEISRCCDLYGVAGIDGIGVSTGIQNDLPSVQMVQAIRRQLADTVPVKITGEITETTLAGYRQAGAERIVLLVK